MAWASAAGLDLGQDGEGGEIGHIGAGIAYGVRRESLTAPLIPARAMIAFSAAPRRSAQPVPSVVSGGAGSRRAQLTQRFRGRPRASGSGRNCPDHVDRGHGRAGRHG